MQIPQHRALLMPAFLHGTFMTVARQARTEGDRCGQQYLQDGSFPLPRKLLEVPAGTVVIAHEVADFQRERPAWRLYRVSSVADRLFESLDWQNTFQVGDAFEAFCRQAAWGALHFAVAQTAPHSAQRTALRLQAVLRFWEPLQSVRYLFSSPQVPLTLEELLTAARGWAMDAWCPAGAAPVREQSAAAAKAIGFPDPARDTDLLTRARRTASGGWVVQLTDAPLDYDNPAHLDALKRAYEHFPAIGGRVTPL